MAENDDIFEPNIDPKQLFDDKKFNTIIVSKDGLSKKDSEMADFLDIVISTESTREEKDEALKVIKDKDARKLLIDSIQKAKKNIHKAALIAACWESGLDFSTHYLFFAELVTSADYTCALEAFTVIENMESRPAPEELGKALRVLENAKDKNQLVIDAIALTRQHLNAE